MKPFSLDGVTVLVSLNQVCLSHAWLWLKHTIDYYSWGVSCCGHQATDRLGTRKCNFYKLENNGTWIFSKGASSYSFIAVSSRTAWRNFFMRRPPRHIFMNKRSEYSPAAKKYRRRMTGGAIASRRPTTFDSNRWLLPPRSASWSAIHQWIVIDEPAPAGPDSGHWFQACLIDLNSVSI